MVQFLWKKNYGKKDKAFVKSDVSAKTLYMNGQSISKVRKSRYKVLVREASLSVQGRAKRPASLDESEGDERVPGDKIGM